MKFLFVSNYINHHQIPFCNAMYELLGENFGFLQTQPMEEERVQMGWQQEVVLPYLYKYYEKPELGKKLIADSAVVMFGGVEDENYIADRLHEGKPVIRCSERLYKEGQWKAISPRGLRKKYLDHTRYRHKEVYLLCAGAYVASDFHIVRAYPSKMLKWGYFPETRHYDVDNLFQNKEPASILWAARFLDWKHPELPVEVAKWLRDKGYDFHMDIIGGGELQEEVEKRIADYGLQECVNLRGFLPPGEVRKAMERADIYLATSDRKEGWGAVINEAMNSGCAVVADHMMGAVPFLLKNDLNGCIYRDGDVQMLCRQVEELVKNREHCRKLGKAAYRTIVDEWNAENVADRLIAFCIRKGFLDMNDLCRPADWKESRFDGKEDFPDEGPCSKASVVSERKMFSLLNGKR